MSGWEKDAIVESARWEADPVVQVASAAAASISPRNGEPLIVLGPGLPVPEIFRVPPNPNSKGHYPLGRRFTPGDEYVSLITPRYSFESTIRSKVKVTKVEEDKDRVEGNDGQFLWDLMGNQHRSAGAIFDPPRQFNPAELHVGRKWLAVFRSTQMEASRNKVPVGRSTLLEYQFAIVAREPIRVPAGEFEAFRAEGQANLFQHITYLETIWIVPYLNLPVRWDRAKFSDRTGHRTYQWADRIELFSAKQHAIGV